VQVAVRSSWNGSRPPPLPLSPAAHRPPRLARPTTPPSALGRSCPGVLRSGGTFFARLFLCLSHRKTAARYLFVLVVPAVLTSGLFSLSDAIPPSDLAPTNLRASGVQLLGPPPGGAGRLPQRTVLRTGSAYSSLATDAGPPLRWRR